MNLEWFSIPRVSDATTTNLYPIQVRATTAWALLEEPYIYMQCHMKSAATYISRINSSPCAWMKSFLNKWNLLYHQCICIVMPKPSGKHVRYLDVRSARMRIEQRRWRIYNNMTPRTKSQLGMTTANLFSLSVKAQTDKLMTDDH